MNNPQIVILGAGYAGMVTATQLQKKLGVNEADIVLVNKNDYHYQSTWLHENAAGTLSADQTKIDIKEVIHNHQIRFVQDTVVHIDKEKQVVTLENGELTYDYLVVGLGFQSETFGIEGLKEHAFSIANMDASLVIRQHIEMKFAQYSHSKEKNSDDLTIVVGGAGFTGIELVGELANRVPELCKEYNIPRAEAKIICVEAAPMILPGFDEELVSYARTVLEKKGVTFKIGTPIKKCTPDGIIVGVGDDKEELLPAGTVVWAAGVRGSDLIESSSFENMRGRVKVDPFLRSPGHENVFVVGDCSLIINEETNRPYPPTAQIAVQQGIVMAHNLAVLVRGRGELHDFKPDIKGTVCSLGHDDAIGCVFGKNITGWKASVMKKVIDNRYLFVLGGPLLVFKKGKLKLF
ncbi:MAG: NAD(P)/FAD-dependent oxidoreductase [Bacilli bacterium]